MTRSIFDPTGPDTERSGSRNLGPDAGNLSHMPSDVVDGKVSEEEVRDEAEATGEREEPPTGAPGSIDSVGFDADGDADSQPIGNPDATIVPPGELSNPGGEAR